MASATERLDVLMVERQLAESRARAQAMILAGQVIVEGQRVDKAGARVRRDAEIRLKGESLRYVSRGGLKLEAALTTFHLDVAGAVCADIGASTGGFTDCLLQRGALRVYAIDVGRGQLHQRLRVDPRVISRERVNARALSADELPERVQVMVIDVSFISLAVVLPAVVPFVAPLGVVVALVKPQFEAGPDLVEKGGVVRDATVRQGTIEGVEAVMRRLGLTVVGVVDSPIAGPAGNVEALVVARVT